MGFALRLSEAHAGLLLRFIDELLTPASSDDCGQLPIAKSSNVIRTRIYRFFPVALAFTAGVSSFINRTPIPPDSSSVN